MNTTTEKPRPGRKHDSRPTPRYKLKHRLKRSPTRSKGWVQIAVSISEDELHRINARCKELNLMRSAYFRQIAASDILYNGPLALHALRYDLLRDIEASLAMLKNEREQLGVSHVAPEPVSQTPDARPQTASPVSAASEPSNPAPSSTG